MINIKLLDKYYSNHKAPHTIYKEIIKENSNSATKILDYGCGRGDSNWIYPDDNFNIYGVDVTEKVYENTRLKDAKLIQDSIPFPDNYFDLVISTWVLEHLPNPTTGFKEIYRVLKPNGKFIFLTPNKKHYVSLIARYSPHIFHQLIVSKILKKEEEEVYPTVYLANSKKKIKQLAVESNLSVEKLLLSEPPPTYLLFNSVLFYCGYLYERILSRYGFLSQLRHSLIGVLVKE